MQENGYKIVKYFDTYPGNTVKSGCTKSEADKIADELNETIKHLPHTGYLVRAM